MRPPKEYYDFFPTRSILWMLTKFPYGMVEAWRQWQIVIDTWFLHPDGGGLERVLAISQLFMQRNSRWIIVLLIAKITDDFLIAGQDSFITQFISIFENRFQLSKIVKDEQFFSNGCEIKCLASGCIHHTINRYVEHLIPINLRRARRTV